MSHQPEFTDNSIKRARYLNLHRKLLKQTQIERGYQQAINEMYRIMTSRFQVMQASGSTALKNELGEIESGDMSFMNEEVK